MSAAQTPVGKGTFLQRAIILYHQGRYQRMEEEVRKELAEFPEDARAHVWLGLALSKQKKEDEALAVLGEAVHLQPDLAFAHYVRSIVLFRAGKGRRMVDRLLISMGSGRALQDYQAAAEASLREAMRLDAEGPQYYDLLADIRLEQGRPEEALEAAEAGLQLDPQDVNCLQQRALVLARLGRDEQAREAFKAALARAPENAYIHLELGRVLLRLDAPALAREHLREALRLDPNQEDDARPLLAQAMRRNFSLYRLLDKGQGRWPLQWGGMVGLLVIYWFAMNSEWRLFYLMAQVLPAPLTFALVLLALLVLIDPLANLAVCLNPFGRLVLSRQERADCWWVGGCLFVSLAAGVIWLFRDKDLYLWTAILAFFLIVPWRARSELNSSSLRRISGWCTMAAVVCCIVFVAPFLLPRNEEVTRNDVTAYMTILLQQQPLAAAASTSYDLVAAQQPLQVILPYSFVILGLGIFCMFVPFILTQSAEDFWIFGRQQRKQALKAMWTCLAVALLGYVVLEFCKYLYSVDTWRVVHRAEIAFVVPFAVGLFFQRQIVDFIEKRLQARAKRSAAT